MDVDLELLRQLREQLRRDPSDRDVAFLVSIMVRFPRGVYRAERPRLRQLAMIGGSTARERIVARAAADLLRQPTPTAGVRPPSSGTIERVDAIGEADTGEHEAPRAAAESGRPPPGHGSSDR